MSACRGFSAASFITIFRCLPVNVRHFITSMTSCTLVQGWWPGIFHKGVCLVITSCALDWTCSWAVQRDGLVIATVVLCLNLPSLPGFGSDHVLGLGEYYLPMTVSWRTFPKKFLAVWSVINHLSILARSVTQWNCSTFLCLVWSPCCKLFMRIFIKRLHCVSPSWWFQHGIAQSLLAGPDLISLIRSIWSAQLGFVWSLSAPWEALMSLCCVWVSGTCMALSSHLLPS